MIAPVKKRCRPSRPAAKRSVAKAVPQCVVDPGADDRRAAHRERRRVFFARKIDYIPCRQFLAPEAEALASTPPPSAPARPAPEPSGRIDAYLAGLYETRLLSRDEEQFHFRRMNWLRFRAATERGRLDETRATARQIDAVEALLSASEVERTILITSNLRLVVSIAKKFVNADELFDELVAEGNVALMRAVDKFNFALGNRFSTYATYAIQRHFFRISHRGRQQRRRFTPADESLRSIPAAEPAQGCNSVQIDQLKELFTKFLGELEPREQQIVVARFGFDGQAPRTFRELGAEMGVCKERIRQIQTRAMEKIRGMATEARLEQTVGDWL